MVRQVLIAKSGGIAYARHDGLDLAAVLDESVRWQKVDFSGALGERWGLGF